MDGQNSPIGDRGCSELFHLCDWTTAETTFKGPHF